MSQNNSNTVLNGRGQPIGYVQAGGVFHRKFNPEKHILKFPVPSLCLETGVIDQLKAAGIQSLWFEGTDGASYKTSLAHFLEAATPMFNKQYGNQLALPLLGFILEKRGPALQQLSMWETARVATFSRGKE